jgi:hypothetical protein
MSSSFMRSLVLALVLPVGLAACGGGGGDDPLVPPANPATYGAAAVAGPSPAGTLVISEAFVAGLPSQADADASVVQQCGRVAPQGCSVVLRFGPGQCGALASGRSAQPVPVYGSGVASTAEDAARLAIADCTGKGGTGCTAGNSNIACLPAAS